MYGAFFLGAGILAQSSARLSCVHLCAPARPSPHISSPLPPFSSGPCKPHGAPLPHRDAPVDQIVDVIGDAIAEALESWLGGSIGQGAAGSQVLYTQLFAILRNSSQFVIFCF